MKIIKALVLQSLFDIAIQQSGTTESAFSIAIANERSITDDFINGELLIIPDRLISSNKVLEYYKSKNLKVATAITLQQIEQMPIIGIGTMIIGNNFIIQ